VIKPTVWLQAGVVIIYGSSLDAAPHSHHAIQVIWPKAESLCKLNEHAISELAVVDSKVEHQLQMSEGWVLLIEPKSSLGQELSIKLAGQSFKTFSLPSSKALIPPAHPKDLTKYLIPLFQRLKLSKQASLTNESTVKDKRIQQLVTKLNQCLQGDCIKPTSWRASEVANQLALSESRFLHLFSAEIGIAWRPYLLWRRMICAIQAMIKGRSATEAAHIAGFSDSSHLSRTFRNTFGMTIRQTVKIFKKS